MIGPHNQAAVVLADAARAVAAVSAGQSADAALAVFDANAQRAAIRAITLGTLRWYLRLQPAIDSLLARPESLDGDVHALLMVAAHQIEYSRTATHSAVHAAVDAVRVLRHAHASGLINAVLRKFLLRREALFARIDQDVARRTAHPRWFVDALTAAWPDQAPAVLAADNSHPPLTLRLNARLRSLEQYRNDLAAAGLTARMFDVPGARGESVAVILDRPVPVTELPGFRAGWVSVQDTGAQLAGPLLDVRPGMRVLDACAAPGSKSAHILEQTPAADLWALDIDPVRLRRVEATFARLALTGHLVAADVREPDTFWDGRPFERILVDAPCSGTGVIRRHPDIKLLRRAEDIAAFAAKQFGILQATFRMLAPGGRLVYATCSVLPDENERVLERFLAETPQARVAKPTLERLPPDAMITPLGVQLLTGGALLTDGFYYACVEKTTGGA